MPTMIESPLARLSGELLEGARLLMRERPPWEADPPWGTLLEAAFPRLVISGAHSPVFEAVCDALATALEAGFATASTDTGHSEFLEFGREPALLS